MTSYKRVYTVLIFLILLAACGRTIYGVYHRVEQGQTLWRIAKTYNADIQEISEINDIDDPADIEIGQRIFIPGAKRVLNVSAYPQGKEDIPEKSGIFYHKGRFIWPVKGEITSRFGVRDVKKHDGIDIRAPKGTPIMAADDGKVTYSGEGERGLRGYGNLILISHKDDYVTVYAHNECNLVKEGDVVKKGQKIALVGDTGRANGTHLHFEIRKDRKPRNPIFFLP
ncbi:MAG: LysM peptidoglycan-binding domain-containing M23 family metallopeptidase [Desulfobacteria bacterium]